MENKHKIAVLDFGGQYAHLIANRVRRLGVYSEIAQPEAEAGHFSGYSGIIFSGGPHSVYDKNSPAFNPAILDLGKPVLGICYGHQLICHTLGGTVKPGKVREFGRSVLQVKSPSPIFKGLSDSETVWMSHGDSAEKLPQGFSAIAGTKDCGAAAVADEVRKIYGFQFHPEVTHTPGGMKMLGNFLDICACERDWNIKQYLERITAHVTAQTKGRGVFLLVSGGVDSTVAFALLNRVLGEKKVLGLHIDNGFMRKNETEGVKDYLNAHKFHNLIIADCGGLFLDRLRDIADPEKKRRIIGDTFIDAQRIEMEKLELDPAQWMLGQGTIYPDTIESGGTRHAALIKTHHNRVPVIAQMIKEGKVIEPLADLYKDEVRELGTALGIPAELVNRHPFPGPGLGVRTLCADGKPFESDAEQINRAVEIAKETGYKAFALPLRSVGVQGDFRTYAAPLLVDGEKDWEKAAHVSTEVTNQVRAINRVVLLAGCNGGLDFQIHKAFLTRERLDVLREADDIATRFLQEAGLYDKIWQMPVVLLPLGNAPGKEAIVLRPVGSSEAMTADFYRIPFEGLKTLTERILAVPGICAVFYDVTNKPPGTIEWE